MKKSELFVLPDYFDRYINLVDDVDINLALEKFGENLILNEKKFLIEIGNKIYQDDKWSIKDILQHIIDTERIFTYRALSFARKDKTSLPSFNENNFAKYANANNRELDDLIHEFKCVRDSSIQLFKSFNDENLLEIGISFNKEISVLAIGFTMVGHLLHHLNIIKERYYPLINL